MLDLKTLLNEVRFHAVKSSGSGGQHINKVATKVVLTYNLTDSKLLNEDQKNQLKITLKHRVNTKGDIVLYASDTRSQLKNKNLVIKRFINLISEGLKIKKKRIPTKIPKSVDKKRLDTKRRLSEKKANRKPPPI